ncbi:MAG TPA: peroxidase family protein [Solirubrobacteraceae bacterium]|nr:peroxidase family protein [Solirubrobacteraceae bacterium]
METNEADIDFILAQIQRAEAHAAGGQLLGTGPNQVSDPLLPYGLRTVNGTYNNIVPGQEHFGSADRLMPRLVNPFFRAAEPINFDPDGPGPLTAGPTSYANKTGAAGIVQDSQPRTISNLIVDSSGRNPAVVAAAGQNPNAVPPADLADAKGSFFLPNVAPDVGLSAPYNSWFTLFGQFFDHGLDLTTKGGSGTVVIPLKEDDPLFEAGSPTNFMVLTRANNQKGTDGIMGTTDDVQEHQNTTTPFVDQNQTYTSHPSHQVFLREYELRAAKPFANGRLLDREGGLARWTDVKAEAIAKLGIALDDQDVLNVPLVLTDQYGKFIPHPTTGMAQIVTSVSSAGVVTGTASGTPGAPIDATQAVRTNHAFLDDIAHAAAPFGETDTDQTTPRGPLTPDGDTVVTTGPQAVGQYDNELLNEHFITGDGRGNENIGLSTVHFIFHAEHNSRIPDIKALIEQPGGPALTDWQVSPGVWNGERLFQAARFVTEMQYQHLVFEEFARKVQPQINLFAGYDSEIDPAIVSEFANTVYRFGHSMLTETVGRKTPAGADYDIGLIPAFLNPLEFRKGPGGATLSPAQAAGGIVRGMSRQVGNELDEFVTGALRNNLVGLPLDLATINMARGRDTGVPTLNRARQTFFNETSNSALRPYDDWADFKLGLRHQESLVNFIAAYGTHASITGATTLAAKRTAAQALLTDTVFMNQSAATSGVDDIDFWVGGLAEKQMVFGGLLGSTFNFVFEIQLEKLQDGDRLYYLSRNAGLNFLTQLEENSFSEMINRVTDTTHLPFDVFSRPDFIFEFANINAATGPIQDDPLTTDYNEAEVLTRQPNGVVRFSGPEHTVFGGTAGNDNMQASEGDDTLWGDGGNDRLEGGDGVDAINGDVGNDIITDLNGDDNIKAGPGNDAVNAGPGFDLLLPGPGKDFVIAGADPKETFGGQGDDFINAGDSADTVFGDQGADWIEGGGQADLLQGEHGDPFQTGRVGDDVIDGGGGNDDYDSEGGDDIQIAGTGTERMEGQIGFDWSTYARTAGPANADLAFTGLLPPDQDNLADRFDLTEGLSGWDGNDTLKGDDADVTTLAADHTLSNPGLITGLQAGVLGGATSFNQGNIILGGNGSDSIEGRGGNDIIDGDRWLNVQLDAPNPATPDTTDRQRVNGMSALQTAVFAGTISPGDINIAREIVTPTPGAFVDTAVYSGPRADYDITPSLNSSLMTINHARGTTLDGVDTVRNVERVQFADITIQIAPLANVNPTTLTFAGRLTGTGPSAAQTVTLTNGGQNALTVAGFTFTGTNPGDFTRSGGTCATTANFTLAGNASCTVNVVFTPAAAGARSGILRFTSNSNNVPGTQTDVALSGTGLVPTPVAAVNPTALTFAARNTGTTSPGQTVTLSNIGNGPLAVSSITRIGTNPGDYARPAGAAGGTCGTGAFNLAAGANCTIVTTFTPTAGGTRTATLRVLSNSNNVANTATTVSLTGTGVLVTPGISLTPANQNFGNNSTGLLGLLGVTRTFTVTSNGTGNLIIPSGGVSIVAAGANAGQFTLGTNNCNNVTRAPGQTCTIQVRFRATSTGAKTATLRVTSNAPQANSTLTGTGT